MRILVIDGHPDGRSFCEAVADSYAAGARSAGHELRLCRLRVLVPGFAVTYLEGFPYIRKLLKGRSARVLYSQNAPQWLTVVAREDLFWRVMRRAILGHCGFAPVRRTVLAPMKGASAGQREAWLREIREAGGRAR